MRAGRKRKSGRRTASGPLAREHVNYAAMAALQPHRRRLPVEARLSQDATTALGRLFLCGKIWEPQKLAGEEYTRRVGSARATMAGPGRMGPHGRWSGCNPDGCRADLDGCECYRRIAAYQELFQVVNRCGHRVEIMVKRVISDADLDETTLSGDELDMVRIGLSALAAHLRLTERGKRAYARNAQSNN
jgi:hypothetical protein